MAQYGDHRVYLPPKRNTLTGEAFPSSWSDKLILVENQAAGFYVDDRNAILDKHIGRATWLARMSQVAASPGIAGLMYICFVVICLVRPGVSHF